MPFSAILIVLAALAVSFLCSLLEACLLSLSRAEIGAIGDRRLAGIWYGLRSDLERPLAVILIVNTCALTIGTSLSAGKIAERYGERGVLIFSIILSFVILQWAEILPKTLGARHRRAVAPIFGILLRTSVIVLAPVTWFVRLLNRPLQGRDRAEPPTTAEELRALAHDASSSHAIEPHQSDIIDRAVGLSRVSARDILIPR